MAFKRRPERPRRIRRALLSASDKTGLADLARALSQHKIEILSTGGTAKHLHDAGIKAREVSDYTGFPEIMDGRVKTLHPKIHGALLSRPEDDAVMQEQGIEPIDLLVLNLYPFEEQVTDPGCPLEQAVENMDIGGPAMLRAAAKNFERVAVITESAQYESIIEELTRLKGALSDATRFRLAVAAFNRVTRYDAAISEYLSSLQTDGSRTEFPQQLSPSFIKSADLRYGENPHQKAAFYRDPRPAPGTLAGYRQIQGKTLSYNNLADADAAWECARGFDATACVIVKHANPCGVALADSMLDAYRRAFACDPQSAYGGIIAFNRDLDAATARGVVNKQFVEVLIAPGFSDDALRALTAKKNLRVLEIPSGDGANRYDLKRIGGGVLVQSTDDEVVKPVDYKILSKREPTEPEMADLLFAWHTVKHVKSNAIVFAGEQATLGIGAGQTSRVMSVRIAALKAQDAGLNLAGAVMASDAFFPFRDAIDLANEAGIRAVIHPGGSKRDSDAIAAADEHDMAMIVTGIRHFKH